VEFFNRKIQSHWVMITILVTGIGAIILLAYYSLLRIDELNIARSNAFLVRESWFILEDKTERLLTSRDLILARKHWQNALQSYLDAKDRLIQSKAVQRLIQNTELLAQRIWEIDKLGQFAKSRSRQIEKLLDDFIFSGSLMQNESILEQLGRRMQREDPEFEYEKMKLLTDNIHYFATPSTGFSQNTLVQTTDLISETIKKVQRDIIILFVVGSILIGVFITHFILRSQAALRESEEDLQVTLNSIGDAVIAADRQGTIIRMNPIAESLTGWAFKQYEHKSLPEVFRLINKKTREVIDLSVENLLRDTEGVISSMQLVLLSHDGNEYPISLSASPIVHRTGSTSGIVLVFRDITNEIAVQEQLKRSERRFRRLFENSEISIWNEDLSGVYKILMDLERKGITDLRTYLKQNEKVTESLLDATVVTEVNEATYALFQIDRNAPLTIQQNFGTGALDIFISQLCAIWNGEKSFRGEVVFRRNNGEEFNAIISFQIPETEAGFRSVPINIIDITENKELEEQLRQVIKMEAVGQLAGGIAHDFNNQLAGMLGYADMLASLVKDNPDVVKYANNIIKTAERAADLTSQLLAFSRKGKYQETVIDIHRIVEEVSHLLEHSIDKKIKIKKQLTADPSTTKGDPTQLQNVVLNIALNAKDAMPMGGEIRFTSTTKYIKKIDCNGDFKDLKSGQFICLTISDTGTGMDEEVLSHIFEPFFTTKELGKGTGMGLAAVYGTIKNHRGAICVKSAPDKGTRFQLYLPVQDSYIQHDVSPSAEIEVKSGKGSIILVDDEEIVREMATLMLQRLGYEVFDFEIGTKAIDFYADHWKEIQCVILDIVMPEMDGEQVFYEMQKINPGIVALISSGYSLDKKAQRILDAGAKDFIKKPYRKYQIAQLLAEILE